MNTHPSSLVPTLALVSLGACSGPAETPCWVHLTEGGLGGYVTRQEMYEPPWPNAEPCDATTCKPDDEPICSDVGQFASSCDLVRYVASGSVRASISYRYGACK